MAYITDKKDFIKTIDNLREKKVSMAVFCTASHWNTEAVLLACSRFAAKYGIERIPVGVSVTFNYPHMPQSSRVTYSGDSKTGFISIMKHLDILCGSKYAPYPNVDAYPHLDHADPERDMWALTDGVEYLASVMFDAQCYPFEENLKMTAEYVKSYGKSIMVEGIIDSLSVSGIKAGSSDDKYVDRASGFIKMTNVDFLVADLGTEQQSSQVGKCVYLKERAVELTKVLGKSMLVLHGTSCLTPGQIENIADDGIIRVNMWTRIAREAGQHAARELYKRKDEISMGAFEACESRRYLHDSIEKAAGIMEEILCTLGYHKLAN